MPVVKSKKKPLSLLISNYGLRWERRFVKWGGSNNKGHLEGVSVRSKKRVVDFRDQIGVYILYDDSLRPIYVGQAGRGRKTLFGRLKDHRFNHLGGRWQFFSWFGVKRLTPSGGKLSGFDKATKRFSAKGDLLLDQFEGIAIAAVEPGLNKQGAKWRGAEQFRQKIDDDLREVSAKDIMLHQQKIMKEIERVAARLERK